MNLEEEQSPPEGVPNHFSPPPITFNTDGILALRELVLGSALPDFDKRIRQLEAHAEAEIRAFDQRLERIESLIKSQSESLRAEIADERSERRESAKMLEESIAGLADTRSDATGKLDQKLADLEEHVFAQISFLRSLIEDRQRKFASDQRRLGDLLTTMGGRLQDEAQTALPKPPMTILPPQQTMFSPPSVAEHVQAVDSAA